MEKSVTGRCNLKERIRALGFHRRVKVTLSVYRKSLDLFDVGRPLGTNYAHVLGLV